MIDGPDGQLARLPEVTLRQQAAPRWPAWYAFDSHTEIGRTALNRVAKRIGADASRLNLLMFDFESSRLGAPEGIARWRDEALRLDAEDGAGQPRKKAARSGKPCRISSGSRSRRNSLVPGSRVQALL